MSAQTSSKLDRNDGELIIQLFIAGLSAYAGIVESSGNRGEALVAAERVVRTLVHGDPKGQPPRVVTDIRPDTLKHLATIAAATLKEDRP